MKLYLKCLNPETNKLHSYLTHVPFTFLTDFVLFSPFTCLTDTITRFICSLPEKNLTGGTYTEEFHFCRTSERMLLLAKLKYPFSLKLLHANQPTAYPSFRVLHPFLVARVTLSFLSLQQGPAMTNAVV